MQEGNSSVVQDLGNRLREWRRSIPLKSYDLAKLISISQGSLSDIENNKSLPSADTRATILTNTNINLTWLLIGQGAMKKAERTGDGLDASYAYEEVEEYGQDPKLKELMEKLARIYNQGVPEKKAHIVGFIQGADPGEKTF